MLIEFKVGDKVKIKDSYLLEKCLTQDQINFYKSVTHISSIEDFDDEELTWINFDDETVGTRLTLLLKNNDWTKVEEMWEKVED